MHQHTGTKLTVLGEAAAQQVYPEQNHLLAALPAAERERLAPSLQQVYLPLDSVLYEPGDVLQRIYFPTDCIVALVHLSSDGSTTGVAVIGNEGVVGVAPVTGGESTTTRAVVQSAGFAYCLTRGRLEQEFLRHEALFDILLRYTQALITQVAQTAVCNRHHSIDQQLCRWLLLSLDRVSSDELTMTHEFIACILGVRREGVSEAAGRLRNLGAIRYARGRITVLDRPRLERLACECYRVVKKEMERLLALGWRDQLHRRQAAEPACMVIQWNPELRKSFPRRHQN